MVMQMTKKYGFIVDGIVDNVVLADESFATKHGLVEVPDYVNGEACGRGWLYSGGKFTKPAEVADPVVAAEPTKEQLLAQLNAIAAQIQAME
jgi:hypothetical protein